MALKAFLVVLLILALACLVAESSTSDVVWGMTRSATGGLSSSGTCNGMVGECINEEDEMMMESDISRRSLFMPKRYISYDILKKNRVPCGKRGQSYYGCSKATKVNPYRRGCSAITHCKRFVK